MVTASSMNPKNAIEKHSEIPRVKAWDFDVAETCPGIQGNAQRMPSSLREPLAMMVLFVQSMTNVMT